jgi:hypothetical protein
MPIGTCVLGVMGGFLRIDGHPADRILGQRLSRGELPLVMVTVRMLHRLLLCDAIASGFDVCRDRGAEIGRRVTGIEVIAAGKADRVP